jgi:hypothetical protein
MINEGSSRQAAALYVMYDCCLPIPHGRSAHWPKPTELLNFDVVRSGSLQRGLQGLSRYQLLTGLTLLAGRMAGFLRRERVFVGVVLLLSPDVDLVLRSSGKYVIQLPVVMNGRDPALGKSTHRLLLFWGRNRDHLKARLR